MKIINKLRLVFLDLTWRAKGLKIYSLYKSLVKREYWSKDQWENFQNAELRSFIKHCYNNVPYYRELFDEHKIKVSDINTKEDLVKIPVLTKELVRNNQEKLLATNILSKDLKSTSTSGSTGTPLTLYSGKNRQLYLAAGLWRIYRRCGWQPGERIAYIWGFKENVISNSTVKKSIKEFLTGATYLSAWKANDEDFTGWYRTIIKDKVSIIVCYASSGSRFAKWLLDNGLELTHVKGVFCTSEKLFDYQKETMTKAFNCNVYNLYGCGEVNHVACTCEKGKMHINPDMVIVETAEKNLNGDTALVLTGFRNLAMPFLRYVNGDAGKILDETCDCGRNTSIMDLDVTRLSDVFTFANGKKYPSLYFILRLYKEGFDGVELFQFYQDRLEHIYLYIVKNQKFTSDTEMRLIDVTSEIENHIENQAKVTLVFTDYIEQSKSSKHYYAKSDVR